MAKVKGTGGKFISVQMTGVGAAIKKLREDGIEVEHASDLGVIKAGAFVEEEVKESIMGNRAEPKSVDTGLLINSIDFERTGIAEGIVEPESQTYPGTSTTTKDTATFMEFGTSRIAPRRHFTNTKQRTQSEVQEIIRKEVLLALRRNIVVGRQALRGLV